MAARELDVEVLEQPDASVASGVGPGRIARELEEIEPVRNRDRTRQVGDEDEAGLERRDQQRLEAFVVPRDLSAELVDACLQLLPREVDVPEARRPYDASSSRYRSARRSMSRL
jgi:hypothetical protein